MFFLLLPGHKIKPLTGGEQVDPWLFSKMPLKSVFIWKSVAMAYGGGGLMIWKKKPLILFLLPARFSILDVWLHFFQDLYGRGRLTAFRFGSWPQTFSEMAPWAASGIRHHSAQSEYSINRCTPMVFDGSPFLRKTKHFCGFRPPFICAVSIWGWQSSGIHFYLTVRLCGKPSKDWSHM